VVPASSATTRRSGQQRHRGARDGLLLALRETAALAVGEGGRARAAEHPARETVRCQGVQVAADRHLGHAELARGGGAGDVAGVGDAPQQLLASPGRGGVAHGAIERRPGRDVNGRTFVDQSVRA